MSLRAGKMQNSNKDKTVWERKGSKTADTSTALDTRPAHAFKDGRDAQQQEVNRLDRAAAQRGAAIIIKWPNSKREVSPVCAHIFQCMIMLYHISLTIKDCCGQSLKYHRKKQFSKYLMLFLSPFHHQPPILIFSFWNEKLLNFLCMTHRVHQQENEVDSAQIFTLQFVICRIKQAAVPLRPLIYTCITAPASHHLIRTSLINKTDPIT